MPFPSTREALEAAGYVYEETKHCQACGAPMLFFATPRGAHIPMSFKKDSDTELEAHFASCSDPGRFRKKK